MLTTDVKDTVVVSVEVSFDRQVYGNEVVFA